MILTNGTPPKPKWMRWSTYHRAEATFDRYEEALDLGCLAAVAKFSTLIGIGKKGELANRFRFPAIGIATVGFDPNRFSFPQRSHMAVHL